MCILYVLFKIRKEKTATKMVAVSGAEKGIRTLGTVLAVHTISNRAPSASSDISAFDNDSYYITTFIKNQVFFVIF